VTNLSVYCPALLAGNKIRAIHLYRIRMQLSMWVVTLSDRQICTLLLASALSIRHKVHLMPFVAGHGRHHVDIGWEVVQLLGQGRRARKDQHCIRAAMSGNYVERVILNYFSKIGTFKTNTVVSTMP
jgi:hypothetical protein